MRGRGLGYLALVGATLAWAGNYLLGVIAVGETDPVSLTWLRWALAVVPLFVIAQLIERPGGATCCGSGRGCCCSV